MVDAPETLGGWAGVDGDPSRSPVLRWLRLGGRRLLEQLPAGQRWLLRRSLHCNGPHGRPSGRPACAVLRTAAEVTTARETITTLGLPHHRGPEKDWDLLIALQQILAATAPGDLILDAGAEDYSTLLPSLRLYGYRRLIGGNLAFTRPRRYGAIRLVPMDITRTGLPDASVGAVGCLSVIEHGVDRMAYVREMARILKPGGVVVTSADFWSAPIDARGQEAFGVPFQVLTPAELQAMVQEAGRCGLELAAPLDLAVERPVVHWAEYDLRYTFIVFTLRKPAA